MNWSEIFIHICELVGTAAFSVSGSLIAIRRKLDLFGVLFLGVITALGGGVIRDLLIGRTPPVFFYSYEYLLVAACVSVVVFIISATIKRAEKAEKPIQIIVHVFDSLGLGIFGVAGVNAAIEQGYGENVFLVIFIGMTTAVGGGLLRDIMSNHTPYIFEKHIYATAAIFGCLIFYVCDFVLKINSEFALVIAVTSVVVLRSLAAYFRWSLPKINKDR